MTRDTIWRIIIVVLILLTALAAWQLHLSTTPAAGGGRSPSTEPLPLPETTTRIGTVAATGRDAGAKQDRAGTRTVASTATNTPARSLLAAIRQVESGGDDNAVGDGGRALGSFQCWRGAWQDATKYGKVNWPYSDARDANKAAQVVLWYAARYGAKTDREVALCWHWGPTWRRYGDGYWRKVQGAMR